MPLFYRIHRKITVCNWYKPSCGVQTILYRRISIKNFIVTIFPHRTILYNHQKNILDVRSTQTVLLKGNASLKYDICFNIDHRKKNSSCKTKITTYLFRIFNCTSFVRTTLFRIKWLFQIR